MVTIKTYDTLYTEVISDLNATFGVNIPAVGKFFLRAVAKVHAMKLRLYYLAIGYLQKNFFADTADPKIKGGNLESFGVVKLGRNPFTAVAGVYDVEVTGNSGSLIPAGTSFVSTFFSSLNPGRLFILPNDHYMNGTTDTIRVICNLTGVQARVSVGVQMTLTVPLANINKTATVTTVVVEPKDAELTEDYRRKTLDAYRLEPQGGAAADYRLWSSSVDGVYQTYPFAKSGSSSELNLYVEADITNSLDGKGTPTTSILNNVGAVILQDPTVTKTLNDRGRKPLHAIANVLAVTVREIEITIDSYAGITSDQQAANLNALTELLASIRPFVGAIDVYDLKNDILDTNKIIAALLTANPGAIFGTITIEVDSVPVSSFEFTEGNIPHLQSVSYTP